jgi:hypothetical protein
MRTASAYIFKLKAEALARTFKVQDTNHRLFTSTLYRGAAGCGPVNYDNIKYTEVCKCDYIGPAKRFARIREMRILDGGQPNGISIGIIDGNGNVQIRDGGLP